MLIWYQFCSATSFFLSDQWALAVAMSARGGAR